MKKMLLVLLVLVMVASMAFAGCQKPADKAGDSGTDATKKPAATKAEDAKEEAPCNPAGTFPIVNEKITVDVQATMDQYTKDLDTNLATLWMEEQSNIHLEFRITHWDKNQKNEKIFAWLASGDYPEVFLDGSFENADILDYGVRQGIFVPIEDLVAEYAPRINQVNEEEVVGFLQNVTAPDGHLYGIPSMNECFHCQVAQKSWINTTWMKNLGLDYEGMDTVAEFTDVLKAFRDQDANGNGDPNDEIPFHLFTDSWHGFFYYLMTPFVYCDENNFFVIDEDYVIDFAPRTDEWREGLKWMSMLVEEGLLAPESFSTKQEQLIGIVNSAQTPEEQIIGGFTGGHLQIACTLDDDNPNATGIQFDAMYPLEGPAGVKQSVYWATATNGARYVITDACQNPAAMVRWQDLAWTEEGTLMLHWGPEKNDEIEQWAPAAEGEKDLLGQQAKWEHKTTLESGTIQNVSWRQAGPICRTFLGYRSRWANSQDDRKETGYELYLYKRSLPYKELIPEMGRYFTGIFMDPEDAPDAKKWKTELEEYTKLQTSEFALGNKDINDDAVWQEYLDGLKDLNVEPYLEIYNEGWAAKVKNMGLK